MFDLSEVGYYDRMAFLPIYDLSEVGYYDYMAFLPIYDLSEVGYSGAASSYQITNI